MGIDIHGLNFLRYDVRRSGPLRAVVTLGRQGLNVPGFQIDKAFGTSDGSEFGPFCESLLEVRLGATSTTAVDNSDFEGAALLHDMNEPFSATPETFDTVLDMGTLEHIFNVPQALANVSALCKVGGRIVHVLPANQQCGHGFWQFSPELFFSLYSEENGYGSTEVFVAEIPRSKRWWRVTRPVHGERANIQSRHAMYVLCRTTRTDPTVSHDSIQQSDYVHVWDKGRAPSQSALPKTLKASPLGPFLSTTARRVRTIRTRHSTGVNSRNPHLTEVIVAGATP